MRQFIIQMAVRDPYGIHASQVADILECSREWARKLLNELVEEEVLKKRVFGPQSIIYLFNRGNE